MDPFQEEDEAGTSLKSKTIFFCIFQAGVAQSKVLSAGADTFRSAPKGEPREGRVEWVCQILNWRKMGNF